MAQVAQDRPLTNRRTVAVEGQTLQLMDSNLAWALAAWSVGRATDAAAYIEAVRTLLDQLGDEIPAPPCLCGAPTHEGICTEPVCVTLPDSCHGCATPNSTRGGMYCTRCRS